MINRTGYVAGIFVSLCAISLLNPILSVVALAILVFAGMFRHATALQMLILLAAFKAVFSLDAEAMSKLTAFAAIVVIFRSVWKREFFVVLRRLHRYPLLAIFAGIVSLAFVHVLIDGTPESETRFAWLLLALFVGISSAACREDIRPMFVVTGVLVAVVNFLYLYVPIPQLVNGIFVHTESLRLVGVTDDANSTARWIVPMGIAIMMMQVEKPTKWTIAGLILATMALSATSSKTGIIVFVVAVMLITYRYYGVKRSMKMNAVAAAGFGLWMFAVFPLIAPYAATQWVKLDITKDQAVPMAYYNLVTHKTEAPNPLSYLESYFRFGKGSELKVEAKSETKPDDTKSRVTPAKVDWTQVKESPSTATTGQRVLLWQTGLKIFADHPLLGIGDSNWRREMQASIGFPYSSPHNGFLQIAGAYGIVGAILYLLAMFRVGYIIRNKKVDAWLALTTLGFFVFELFDVSAVFSATLMTMAIWIIVGRLEGEFNADRSAHPRSNEKKPRLQPLG